jgi:anti-anti-sigma regulatory factor
VLVWPLLTQLPANYDTVIHCLYHVQAMTTVYQETLPESYLLLLTPGPATTSEAPLQYGLDCASHSGKPAVWVDCELVHDLSAEAVQILWYYHQLLREQNMKLVVVHACDAVKEELLSLHQGSSLCFAPTLLDAAWQSTLRQVA